MQPQLKTFCGSETPAPSGGAANYAARAMAFPHALRHALAVAVLRRVAAHDMNACREWDHPKGGKWNKDEDCPCAARRSRPVLSFAGRGDGSSPVDTRRLRGGPAGCVRGRLPLFEGRRLPRRGRMQGVQLRMHSLPAGRGVRQQLQRRDREGRGLRLQTESLVGVLLPLVAAGVEIDQ